MAQPKLIVQVRVNEGMPKSRNPHVPYSPEEIADAAIACWHAGAAVVHYHARKPETGAASSSPVLYGEVVRRINEECDLITMPTLGANLLPTAEERLAHIVEMAKDPATTPDCIPVDMLSTNLDRYDRDRKEFVTTDRVYLNTTSTLQHLCRTARDIGVKPVAMMWDVAGVRLTEAFVDMGLYTEPLFCELPLFADGYHGFGHPATAKGLDALLAFFPEGREWQWFTDVTGSNEFSVIAAAIERGGHVAVGLGDHPYPELGLPTNAQLVERVVELAHRMGREVATVAEARAMLGFA